MKLKLKNSILEIEEKLNKLAFNFTKEKQASLKRSADKDEKIFALLNRKNQEAREQIKKLKSEQAEIQKQIAQNSKNTESIKEEAKKIEWKIRNLEDETLTLRKKRVLNLGNLEKLKMRRKEILHDKKMKGELGGEIKKGKLSAGLMQEIRGKIREKLKIEEVEGESEEDIRLESVKRYLAVKKKELFVVKKDLAEAAGNLNSEEFLRHEKEKVKTNSDLIKKERKNLRSREIYFIILKILEF